MVTPRYTAGLAPTATLYDGDHSWPMLLVNAQGNSVAFQTVGGALPGFPGTGEFDGYRSVRTANGWITERHAAYSGEAEKTSLGGVSPGGEYSVERANGGLKPSLWAPWAGHEGGVFLRGPSATQVEPLARGSLGDDPSTDSFSGGIRGRFITEGASHVIFESRAHLEPGAPEEEVNGQVQGRVAIYDRTPGGPTHMVSLFPGNTPQTEAVEFLQSTPNGDEVAFDGGQGCYGCNFTNEGLGPLYVRRNNNDPANAETVEAIKPNGAGLGRVFNCVGGPSGEATLEYQWLRDGAPIPGATESTYTVAEADESHVLQCQVTATNAHGTTFAASDTRVVAPYAGKTFPEIFYATLNPFNYGDVTEEVGTQLSCASGLKPSSATLTYAWLLDTTPVPGATESTYTPSNADIGKTIQCRVTASTADGSAVRYSFDAMTIVAAVPRATTNPTVSDTTDPGSAAPAVGDQLSCSPGTWTASPTFSYEWLREGATIPAATSSTYTVAAADEGKSIQCAVTGTSGGRSTQAVSNRVVPAISGPPTGLPKHHFLEYLGSAEEPTFEHPQGLAVDQSGGDVYVIDAWAFPRTVSRWHPDGTPDNFSEQSNEVSGNKIKYVLGEGTGPRETQVAVDSSGGPTDGNIYITNTPKHTVEMYAATGAPLGELTAAGATPFGEVCGVAVDSAGTVYVGDYSGKVHKFVPSGSVPANSDNTANFNFPETCQVAAGAGPTAAYIFVNSYGGELVKMDASTGEVKYTITTGATEPYVDPVTGYVYAALESEFKGFDASGAGSAAAVSRGKAESPQGIAVRGSTGNVYVSTPWTSNKISVYGPAFQSGPEPPELINAGNVSGTSVVGNYLYCESGSWNGSPTSYSRQWLRNGSPIPGATEYSYHLTAADAETVIECRVTATSDEGSTAAINANSGARYVLGSVPPAATSQIRVNGNAGGVGYTFDGVYDGKVFWNDSRTNFSGQFYETPGNLYTLNMDTEEVTPIATTNDAQMINVAGNGSRAFFTSPSQFNGEGIPGKPNVYMWSASDDSVKYIATVRQFDIEDFGADGAPGLTNLALGIANPRPSWGPGSDHSRVSPDGSAFLFETTAQLTSFNNQEKAPKYCHDPHAGKERCTEVYRYETETGNLECISCGEGNGPATGDGRLETLSSGLGSTLVNYSIVIPNVTEDGETVVFESSEALVPRDHNGFKDVYRWTKGQGVSLISSGRNLGDSALYAMTPNASDIIFGTHQALLPDDENGATTRLYDARVDGGFPPPESSVTEPCSNDVCQGAPSGAPEEPQVSSSSINGRGNASGKLKCGKGLRRRVHHGKEVCVPRKRHHHRHGGSRRKAHAGNKRGAGR